MPQNTVIVDLDKAPRKARSLVEYDTNFSILRPADPSQTTGVLVYDVPNRDSKLIFALLDDVSADSTADRVRREARLENLHWSPATIENDRKRHRSTLR
jgi:hypothetical protein